MGNVMSNAMGAAMRSQADAQAAAQARMIERQIEMQQQMRERMVATQIAMGRDMLRFYGAFAALLAAGLGAAAARKRNPAFLGPLLPLSFVLAYQYDLAYHTKLERVGAEADAILLHERHLLRLPGPALTVPLLDSSAAGRLPPAGGAAPVGVSPAPLR